jgi:hypothetical protein
MDPRQFLNSAFIPALADYFYLIERGYPERVSIKIVGDRYRLGSEMRTLLYRGITSTEKARRRARRILAEPQPPLIIDGYNVLFTLMNYRSGRFVFISNDRLCRDAGSFSGKIRSEKILEECINQLANYLQPFKQIPILIYLDEPIPNSSRHAQLLSTLLKNLSHIEIKLVKSADEAILQHTEGTIATSDSELIDHSKLTIMDVAEKILKEIYNAVLFRTMDLLKTL